MAFKRTRAAESGVGGSKWLRLRARLLELGRVLVAYSGGLDSAFLAKAAVDALGNDACMVLAVSEGFPAWERERALAAARAIGFRPRLIRFSQLGVPGFARNGPDRCYLCKRRLFRRLGQLAGAGGFLHVLDGTTADDLSDHRPGRRAGLECGVLSPLLETDWHKPEIRRRSRQLGLPTWDQPSSACLASRIPYREAITPEKLRQVERAEDFLRGLGLAQCRVRHHGALARIEVAPEARLETAVRARRRIVRHLRSLGFMYVSLDLAGYRTGSLNEGLRELE